MLPDHLMPLPVAVIALSGSAVTVAAAVGTDAAGVSNGPLYSLAGAIVAAGGAVATAYFYNRRHSVPETPDVTAKLDTVIERIAKVETKIEDDRISVAANLAAVQKASDDKLAVSRHEQAKSLTRIELMVQDIQRQMRGQPRDDT